MATGVDVGQIDRAQESALHCARNASGSTSVERRANCEVCCYTEYGLKGLYRTPRTPWSEGSLEACVQSCVVTDGLQKNDSVARAPPQEQMAWESGSWAHDGADKPFGDNFLTWTVPNRCVLREHDTAKHRRPSLTGNFTVPF